MNFNNNLPNMPPFNPNASNDAQMESFMKLFGNATGQNPPNDPSLEDRSKNPGNNNVRAAMTQMLLNNYRNYLLTSPTMNPLMGMPPMGMMPPMMPSNSDPMGLRRGNAMNEMMMQAMMSKYNMFNMMSPYSMYPMAMGNPMMNPMMMDSLLRNYFKDLTASSPEPQSNTPNYTVVNLDTSQNNNPICVCQGKKHCEESQMMTCGNDGCRSLFHLSCLKYVHSESDCPYCFLKKMDPLNPVMKVVVPPFLLGSAPGILYKKKINLDIESLKLLIEDENVCLEFRSVRLDETYKYETSWIDYGMIQLNDNVILELNPLQTNSCLKKRKDEKVSTKQFIKPEQNELKITLKSPTEEESKALRIDRNADFLIGVYLVRKISNTELLKKVMERNLNSELISKAFLQTYFCKELSNHSEDLFLDQMKINLLDPIDFQSIKTPARGRFCKHFNCFSLESFVTVIKDSVPRKWRCPICKQPCYEFHVDGFLLKIISEANSKGKLLKEMILFDDGRYEVTEELPNQDDFHSERTDDEEQKESSNNHNKDRFSLVIEETGEVNSRNKKNINDGLSENTKSTVNEENKPKTENTETVVGQVGKKRRNRMALKGEGKGYQLRSKKVCLNKP